MKTFLLEVHCELSQTCAEAMLELDDEEARTLLARRDLLIKLRADDKELHELVYWDCGPGYIDYADAVNIEVERYLEIDEPWAFDVLRTEFDRVHVTEFGIHFTADIKHTDTVLSTAELPWAEVEKTAGVQCKEGA